MYQKLQGFLILTEMLLKPQLLLPSDLKTGFYLKHKVEFKEEI